MRNWRKNMKLPKVFSPTQLKNILYDPEWEQLRWYDGNNSLSLILNHGRSPQESLVIFDESVLQAVNDATVLTVVTTSSVAVPLADVKRILLINAIFKNHIITCFWAFIRNYNDCDYEVIFNLLKQAIANPNKIYIPFNISLESAVKEVYPEAEVNGSYYSFCSELYHIATIKDVLQDEIDKIILRKIMALPLLPANQISESYYVMKRNMTLALRNKFKIILEYFEQIWLDSVGVQKLSKFDKEDELNSTEKSTIQSLLNKLKIQPKIWTLFVHIQDYSRHALADIQRLTINKKVSHLNKFKGWIDSSAIKRQWRLYSKKKVNLNLFLKRVTFILQAPSENLKFILTKERQLLRVTDFQQNPEWIDEDIEDIDEDALVDVDLFDEINPDMGPQVDENNLEVNAGVRINVNDAQNVNGRGGENDINVVGENDESSDDDDERRFPPRPAIRSPEAEEYLNLFENYEDEPVSEEIACVSCITNKKCYLMEPCGQIPVCTACLKILLRQVVNGERGMLQCPGCAEVVQSIRRVFY